eukprot:CAMPEP_0196725656 /NCGR_PEP_ID=MMETSP1091-20130531/7137_1 /TAXON_ID=302021 /ORGANISM="Rhodomonas sp., Strain CCMP768" /LENGTH=111 /DNA_ID=CAMNT_0042067955 /DNA_START=71 /DNA_END=406 /DNA_ORIENTATION=+
MKNSDPPTRHCPPPPWGRQSLHDPAPQVTGRAQAACPGPAWHRRLNTMTTGTQPFARSELSTRDRARATATDGHGDTHGHNGLQHRRRERATERRMIRAGNLPGGPAKCRV